MTKTVIIDIDNKPVMMTGKYERILKQSGEGKVVH